VAAPIQGEPGSTWTNDTGKVQYQLIVDWVNSCGLCCQFDHQVGPSWPIPFHRGCRCRQRAIWPGKESLPFVDFREKILELDRPQRSRVIGASALVLVEKGVIGWDDVVTKTRVRSLREVVSRLGLTVDQMAKAGVRRDLAAKAHQSVNTPAHELAEQHRKELIAKVVKAGVSPAQVKEAVARKLAARVSIGAGPSGPSGPATFGPDAIAKLGIKVPAVATHPTVHERVPKPTGPPREYPKASDYAANPPAAPPKPKTPAKPKLQAFPADPGKLEVVKKLGGSTGAELVRDADGRLFVRKVGKNPGHLREEAIADDAYRALGVAVPRSKLYETAGGPVKLSEFHEGVTLGELMQTDPAAAQAAMARVRKHFVADALLANWDFAGANLDNLLVTPSGDVLRIDNGGSLRYRAQGGAKGSQWGGHVGELTSLLDPQMNSKSSKVFAGIGEKEILAQARAILRKRSALLKAVPAELHATLKERLDYLDRAIVNPPPDPTKGIKSFTKQGVPVTSADRKAMADWGEAHWEQWKDGLTPEDRKALKYYKGSGYRDVNEHLRFGNAPAVGKAKMDEFLARIDESLNRAATPEELVLWRGVSGKSKMGLADPANQIGEKFGDKGYVSISQNRESAENFTHGPDPAMFRIRVPKGTPAGYLELLTQMGEYELLFHRGTKFKITGVGTYDARRPLIDVELIPSPLADATKAKVGRGKRRKP
jgi:hypothetical protein